MIICLTYNTRLPNIWELSPKWSFVLCITILYLSCIFVAFALCLHYNCIVTVSRLVAYKKNDSPCLEAIMGPQLTYYRLNVSLYKACMMKKLHAIDLLCNLDVISITAYLFLIADQAVNYASSELPSCPRKAKENSNWTALQLYK